jgi:NAD(P)-dependent dehydrogenase (short-subunit alcohol dehydrogenase family)
MNLKNATALVTGGSSGIGQGIAEALIAAGARVAITGRDKARLDAAAKSMGAVAINADVSKEADVQRTMSEVVEKFGHLDILVTRPRGIFPNASPAASSISVPLHRIAALRTGRLTMRASSPSAA